jgi:hypothetical protein
MLTIGAPTLIGESADALAAKLQDAEFPLVLDITSHAPFNLSLPEARVFLRPSETRAFTVADAASLARMVRSAAQVAELNSSAKLVTLKAESLDEAEQANDAVADSKEADQEPVTPDAGDQKPEAAEVTAKPEPAAPKRSTTRRKPATK